MTATTTALATAPTALSRDELIKVLCTSLYPGAKPESALMVLNYCTAAGLDPMTKPVHIVPMQVKIGTNDRGSPVFESRDVIMPGINLYRARAFDTGQYLGMSDAEFGPMRELVFQESHWENKQQNFREARISYPEWCQITVSRRMGADIAKFTVIEYWLENYATVGKDSIAPNAMWKKRPIAQLLKCARAQALREGFGDRTGSAATADEMEGKEFIDHADIQGDGSVAPKSGPAFKARPTGAAKAEASAELQVAAKAAMKRGSVEYLAWWETLQTEERSALVVAHPVMLANAKKIDTILAEEASDAAKADDPNATVEIDPVKLNESIKDVAGASASDDNSEF